MYKVRICSLLMLFILSFVNESTSASLSWWISLVDGSEHWAESSFSQKLFDLVKTYSFTKEIKIWAKILLPTLLRCITSFHKFCLEIICRIILVRWKLRFTRIDEMITSLTPHPLQYKPMSIILRTTHLTFKLCYLKGMMSLLWICFSTVSGLSSWKVGWMKWCERLMFAIWKTLK